ncbi:MAG: glycosyltransferase family 2 protein [Actinomycetota bacterium]|nr:glycosyltransferase family 2 protein [Actinomycetota bacterium]
MGLPILRLSLPSWGPSLPSGSKLRLFALVAVRDELPLLPGFIANVAPHVDEIVALDDGSSDGSGDFLAARPEVVEVIRLPADRPEWDEMGNHRALVEAALRHGAEWALCVDADERLERDFRARAERVIRRGRLIGCSAFSVRVRELWDGHDRFRADGIWGRKSAPRLFRLRPDHEFDTAALHGIKVPLQARPHRLTDLVVYHLGMLTRADRDARRARYEAADPTARWQSIGYAYLTDERGLQLAPVPRRRGWVE